jgi:hypothetical protein
MRKLFWYSVAAAVLAAVGVYVAADYLDRNPESSLARTVQAPFEVGVRHSPVAALSGAAIERTYEQIQQTMADPRVAPHAMPESEPPTEMAVTPRTVGRIIIQEEEELQSLDGDRLCPVPAEKAAATLTPFCPDDVQVPAYMPYADEGTMDVGKAVFDTFWGLFGNAIPHCPDDHGAPACQVDPNDVYHYPGCPSAHSYQHPPCCPYTGKSAGSAPAAVPHCEYSEESEWQDSEVCEPAKVAPKPGCEKSSDANGPHKGLDTMEFRKSDRRLYEIDYIPY